MMPSPRSPGSRLSPEDRALLTRVAVFVVRRRMTAPAILFLESVRPLNFIGSQTMLFLAPFVKAFLNMREYEQIQQILENRESISAFVDLLEEEEERFLDAEKAQKSVK